VTEYILQQQESYGDELPDMLIDVSGDAAVDIIRSLRLMSMTILADEHGGSEPFAVLEYALDADETGGKAWRELARQARLRGRQVHFLPAEAYGGHKDPAAAWEAGVLQVTVPAPSPAFTVIESDTLGERIAILHDEEAAGPPELVAFRPSELKLLEGVTPDELRQVYAAKKFWRGLIVKKGGAYSPTAESAALSNTWASRM